ncbi:MAG: RNA polymerase sigma factor [Hamadaea sp.]|nr:RNA polymerase sigma factor [Hamadaea sp.]
MPTRQAPGDAAAVADRPDDLAGMFDRYARDLLRYCAQRVGSDLAEDVVAETFLIAHEKRDRFDPKRGDLLPWLYGIATNVLRRHRRVERQTLRTLARVGAELKDTDGVESGERRSVERLDAARLVGRVGRALAALPRRQRDVLLLYALAELEYAEIAAALSIPLGSVQSSLHRARTKIRAAIAETGGIR